MLTYSRAAALLLILVSLVTASISESRDTFYIAPSEVFLIQLLEPPPAPDSQAQKADLEAVLNTRRNRTKDRLASAQADDDASVFAFVSNVLGPNFKKDSLPVASLFFERVFVDQLEAAWGTKEHFNRPRPYMIDPSIEPAVRRSKSASYPSGHTTTGYVYATVLAIMVPEKARKLYDRAAEYGRSRVIAGVHFPTDVTAGRVSAAVIANTLLQQPLFRRDLERAKEEVRQVIGLSHKASEGTE